MFENKIYWNMKLNLDETVNETWGFGIFGPKHLMVLALSFGIDIPFRDTEKQDMVMGRYYIGFHIYRVLY